MGSRQKNKYCSFSALNNESDVEQFFVLPLLAELGFDQDFLQTKKSIPAQMVGKGKKRKSYIPDYLGYAAKAKHKPILVVDVKHPNESADEGLDDAQLYASVIRRGMEKPKPDQFCIGVNGGRLIAKHYDSDSTLFDLEFGDFCAGSHRWAEFRKAFNREALAITALSGAAPKDFEFRKPQVSEIRALFEACHDVIWKREFESPVPAFWEFCKLMFIKLHADKIIHNDATLQTLLDAGRPLPPEKVIFSTYYIDRTTSPSNPNPIATNFETVKNELESMILTGEKKRIFDANEHLNLDPMTIRRVVGLLEHHDLIRIDEDLNGRLFQTFLSATMRGKQLGQFFTPRTVVDFMCELADLTVSDKPPYAPLVLDACCGTGGFLIEAMARMTNQLKEGRLAELLSQGEKNKIEDSASFVL